MRDASDDDTRDRCPSGKRTFDRYADALAYLERREREGVIRPGGAVYTCPSCSRFHISSRRFTVWRTKGRGKTRRGVVIAKGRS